MGHSISLLYFRSHLKTHRWNRRYISPTTSRKIPEYNNPRYSSEVDCSQYDVVGKRILGKCPNEEHDALKNVHLHKLKYGKSVNPNYSEALNKIGEKGKIIIDKDNNNSS